MTRTVEVDGTRSRSTSGRRRIPEPAKRSLGAWPFTRNERDRRWGGSSSARGLRWIPGPESGYRSSTITRPARVSRVFSIRIEDLDLDEVHGHPAVREDPLGR